MERPISAPLHCINVHHLHPDQQLQSMLTRTTTRRVAREMQVVDASQMLGRQEVHKVMSASRGLQRQLMLLPH